MPTLPVGNSISRSLPLITYHYSLLTVLLLALCCFALSPAPNAFGVTPAPDGAYPGANTAEGQNALQSLTSGIWNTALGYQALYHSTSGNFNTAEGMRALFGNTTGNQNTATGVQALYNNTAGLQNTATGVQALYSNTSGNFNTAVGDSALYHNTTGKANIALGVSAGLNVTTANNVICIGTVGQDVSNTCFIGNIHGVTTQNNDAIPVLADSFGQLGTANSSRRYKTDIKPMNKASEVILALKPVSFRYKVHKDTTPQFGLIAEDVAKVNPDLVIYDGDGKPYTVRYDAVNAMLLNEFLKAHQKMEEQQATIGELKSAVKQQQKQIEMLTAGLEKVSAQLELNNAAPRTVLH